MEKLSWFYSVISMSHGDNFQLCIAASYGCESAECEAISSHVGGGAVTICRGDKLFSASFS